MPTGYTAELMEKGQPFDKFVLGCARAMGALIMMRDESQDTPIPEKFEVSDFNARRMEEGARELGGLEGMTEDQREAFGRGSVELEIDVCGARRDESRREDARLAEMKVKVLGWAPPTKDHEHFKEFMLDQLKISTNNSDEYYLKRIDELEKVIPNAIQRHVEKVEQAKQGIENCKKSQAEEEERVKGRNEWVSALRGSL